ncbi:MAG: hypothetical protein FJX99_04340, partial [Bacteroidetes bacterium]|nr:hypothetical protein [Bacteroidota bacterium]
MKNLLNSSQNSSRQTGASYSEASSHTSNSILFSPQNFTTMEKSYKSNGASSPFRTERIMGSSPSFLKSLAITLAIFIAGIGSVLGQAVSSYTPLVTSGTYVSIGANGTEILGNVDDGNSSATNIGFTFIMGGQSFTQFIANSNGHIRLGGTIPQSNSAPLSSTSNTYAISAAGRDGRSTGGVVYFLSGTAPNRVGIIQYTNYDLLWDATTRRVSFQIRLYEGTNVIEIIYTGATGTTTTASIQVGLRGTSTTADVRNYSGSSNGWGTLTAGITSTSTK